MSKTRRQFLKTIGLGATALLVSNVFFCREKKTRPNIIYLITDDQRWDFMGCMGNKHIQTPHCDQLAADGILFENAFHAAPICEPCRASVMLGQYLSTHRCGFDRPTDYTVTKKEFANSYPVLLRQAGYRTCFVGKFGFAVTKEKVRNVSYTDGKRDHRTQLWNQDEHMPTEQFDVWYGHSGQGEYDVNGQHRTEYNGDKACEFIEDCAQNYPNQPFSLSISFKAPHGPLQPDPKYLDMYKDLTFPRQSTDNLEHFIKLPSVVRNGYRGRRGYSTEEEYQSFIKSYFALITGVDVVVGRIRETLKKKGLDHNTIIIYTSDNGFFCGSKRLRGKDLLYEESLRAPLIVYDPRLNKELNGRRVSSLVSIVDFAPTMLELAGVPIPPAMQGVSFVPVLKGEKTEVRESIFAENHFADFQLPIEQASSDEQQRQILQRGSVRSKCVRTQKYKYIRYYETFPLIEEMFDIENDQQEFQNLVEDPQYETILNQLRALCDDYLEKCQTDGG